MFKDICMGEDLDLDLDLEDFSELFMDILMLQKDNTRGYFHLELKPSNLYFLRWFHRISSQTVLSVPFYSICCKYEFVLPSL